MFLQGIFLYIILTGVHLQFRTAGALNERGLLARFQCPLGIKKAVKLNHLGYQPCPAGLMTGTESRAIVAMKVLVKEDVVAPVGICLEFLRATIDSSPAVFVAQTDTGESVGDLLAYLEEVHHLP